MVLGNDFDAAAELELLLEVATVTVPSGLVVLLATTLAFVLPVRVVLLLRVAVVVELVGVVEDLREVTEQKGNGAKTKMDHAGDEKKKKHQAFSNVPLTVGAGGLGNHSC